MKLRYLTVLAMGFLITPLSSIGAENAAQPNPAQPAASLPATEAQSSKKLETDKDKLSYSLGQNIGQSIKRQHVDVDLDLLAKGIADSLSDAQSLLTPEEVEVVMQNFRKKQTEEMSKRRQEQAQKNLDEGKKFLEENKKKEGVKTLPSGLQYRVVKEGTGNTPKPTDKVTTHYSGKLLNGTEFDSSYKRNEPTTFPVTGVIQGWQEALLLMKEGSKVELFIPSELAYGQSGRPGIPPNAVLIFDMELISIEKEETVKEAPAAQAPATKESEVPATKESDTPATKEAK